MGALPLTVATTIKTVMHITGRTFEMPKKNPILDYNPTIKWSKQKVRVTFGIWKYRATKEGEVNGNCRGLSVIESAIEDIFEELETEDEHAVIELTDPKGNVLVDRDDYGDGSAWLTDLVVSAEIIAIEQTD